VSVQNDVVVLINEPFSNSLLTGEPPPQTEKYSQPASQACVPARTSRYSADCRQAEWISANELMLMLPSRKSP
jgi:hypothetical protein